MRIKQVQVRHVDRRARRAVTARLGYMCPEAVTVERRGRTVLVKVNSGGNSLAVEQALTAVGYRVEPGPDVAYGVALRILPSVGCLEEGRP